MRPAMSAPCGAAWGAPNLGPNSPGGHSGASASTMSTPNERAGSNGCGGEISSPPRVDPQAGNYAYVRLERVAHDHAHQARVIGGPVRESLAYLLRAAFGRALRVFFREPRLPRL